MELPRKLSKLSIFVSIFTFTHTFLLRNNIFLPQKINSSKNENSILIESFFSFFHQKNSLYFLPVQRDCVNLLRLHWLSSRSSKRGFQSKVWISCWHKNGFRFLFNSVFMKRSLQSLLARLWKNASSFGFYTKISSDLKRRPLCVWLSKFTCNNKWKKACKIGLKHARRHSEIRLN